MAKCDELLPLIETYTNFMLSIGRSNHIFKKHAITVIIFFNENLQNLDFMTKLQLLHNLFQDLQ